MKIEGIKKNERGITLISLIITVIVLLILAGITVAFVTDNRAIEEAEDYTYKMNKQINEQESLSNMVRNLYNK